MWGARINLTGILTPKPIKLSWDKELKCYWDKDGDYDFDPGQVKHLGVVSFASKNKKEVLAWIAGARGVMDMLKDWAE